MHSRGENDPILHIQYVYLCNTFVSGNLYQTIIMYLYVAYSFKAFFHISIMVKKSWGQNDPMLQIWLKKYRASTG